MHSAPPLLTAPESLLRHPSSASLPHNAAAPLSTDAQALLSLLESPNPADRAQLAALLHAARSHNAGGGESPAAAAMAQLVASLGQRNAPAGPPPHAATPWPQSALESHLASLAPSGGVGGMAQSGSLPFPSNARHDLSAYSVQSADTHVDGLTHSELQVVHALQALSGTKGSALAPAAAMAAQAAPVATPLHSATAVPHASTPQVRVSSPDAAGSPQAIASRKRSRSPLAADSQGSGGSGGGEHSAKRDTLALRGA